MNSEMKMDVAWLVAGIVTALVVLSMPVFLLGMQHHHVEYMECLKQLKEACKK